MDKINRFEDKDMKVVGRQVRSLAKLSADFLSCEMSERQGDIQLLVYRNPMWASNILRSIGKCFYLLDDLDLSHGERVVIYSKLIGYIESVYYFYLNKLKYHEHYDELINYNRVREITIRFRTFYVGALNEFVDGDYLSLKEESNKMRLMDMFAYDGGITRVDLNQ